MIVPVYRIAYAFLVIVGGISALDGGQLDKLEELYVSSTARLVRSRGYLAVDHNIDTQDGAATLNLVRATNPRINGGLGGLPDKDPIVFVHGIFTGANCFILNADGVRPKDLSSYNVSSMNLEQLQRLLRNDPASKSLVFTALDFGHEVWLLNRRPTLESQFAHLIRQGLVTKSSANLSEADLIRVLPLLGHSNYWDFSYDEQGEYDIPAVIDYILKRTSREKLAYVGHSAGSITPMITFVVRPEYQDKISKALLWAPAFYDRVFPFIERETFNSLIPFLARSSLPFPSPALIYPVEGAIGSVCQSKLLRSIICDPIVDYVFGAGGNQQMIENYNSKTRFLENVSTKELAHSFRSWTDGIIYPFERVLDPQGPETDNQSSYYDISRIKSKFLSMWSGNTDTIIPIEDMDRLINDLTVPVERHTIDKQGVLFDHVAFLTHNNIADLLIIPSLKSIYSSV